MARAQLRFAGANLADIKTGCLRQPVKIDDLIYDVYVIMDEERNTIEGTDSSEHGMSFTIFLSHSSLDAVWVKWIADSAQRVGIPVYLYEHDPQPGRLVADKVPVQIQSSDALVVLLTRNSQFSAYVQQEIGVARALNKPLIPLVEPGVSERSLAMLHGVEYIRLDFNNPQPVLARLLEYLLKAKRGNEASQALLAVGALVETAARARLSPQEIEILLNVPGDGMIQLFIFEGGAFLRVGPKDLPDTYDPAAFAHYQDALESLQARGLVRHEGGTLYRLTGRGFDSRKTLLEGKSG